MKCVLKIVGAVLLVCILVPYLWWTALSLTFDPDDELHPVNLWFATQAHHAMAPIGDLFGYHEAAEAVRLMYEAEPGDVIRQEGFVMDSVYYDDVVPEVGECITEQLWWRPRENDSIADVLYYLFMDYQAMGAWYGGKYTVCGERVGGQQVVNQHVTIRIAWPKHASFVLPLVPVPAALYVEEGLLHRAAQHHPGINYYTREKRNQVVVSESSDPCGANPCPRPSAATVPPSAGMRRIPTAPPVLLSACRGKAHTVLSSAQTLFQCGYCNAIGGMRGTRGQAALEGDGTWRDQALACMSEL